MDYEVIIDELAVIDLDAIVMSINYNDNFKYLKIFYLALEKKLSNLLTFPKMYTIYKKTDKNEYRKIIFLRFCIIYYIDEIRKKVVIISFNSLNSKQFRI